MHIGKDPWDLATFESLAELFVMGEGKRRCNVVVSIETLNRSRIGPRTVVCAGLQGIFQIGLAEMGRPTLCALYKKDSKS